MKIKKSVRYVCLGLIFAMLCGSVFFGSRSFAKYLEEYKNQQEAGVASPVVVYTRYALTRKQGSEEFTYQVNNNDTSFSTSDIAPGDELNYYFGIKSNDLTAHNEVLLQVTVTFNVYLVVLKQYSVSGVEKVSNVYRGFRVGESYTETTDLRHQGYIAFYKYNQNDGNGLSSEPADYTDDGLLSAEDSENVNYNNSALTNVDKLVKYYDIDGSVEKEYTEALHQHSIGFYLQPGVDMTKGYLIKTKLPSQVYDVNNYIGARLFIEIDVNAKQVLEMI